MKFWMVFASVENIVEWENAGQEVFRKHLG